MSATWNTAPLPLWALTTYAARGLGGLSELVEAGLLEGGEYTCPVCSGARSLEVQLHPGVASSTCPTCRADGRLVVQACGVFWRTFGGTRVRCDR